MKKVVSLLIIISMVSTAVFANDAAYQSINEAEKAQLFSDIDAQELTSKEMEAVDGEGVGSIIAGAIIGGTTGAGKEACRAAWRAVRKTETRNTKQIRSDIIKAAKEGAAWGAVGGAIVPIL